MIIITLCEKSLLVQYMGQLKVSEPKGSKVVRDAIDMVKVGTLDPKFINLHDVRYFPYQSLILTYLGCSRGP